MGLKLRCALSECRGMIVAAPSPGVDAGDFGMIEDTVGVYFKNADTGDNVFFITEARAVVVTSVAAGTGKFTQGSKVYYDSGDGEINESSTGNTLCGVVLETPVLGSEEVLIMLDGTLGIVA